MTEYCPQCGESVESHHQFCSNCGTEITEEGGGQSTPNQQETRATSHRGGFRFGRGLRWGGRAWLWTFGVSVLIGGLMALLRMPFTDVHNGDMYRFVAEGGPVGILQSILISFLTAHLAQLSVYPESLTNMSAYRGLFGYLHIGLTVAVLIWIGYRIVGEWEHDVTVGGIRMGMSITAGYLPLVALVIVVHMVFTPRMYGFVSVAPFGAFLSAGVVFPVLFGGIGGYLASK
jgi:hypothetical protein